MGLLVLLVTLVSGIAWLGFQRWGPWGEAVSASDAPWARASEPARDLTVSEYSLASRYGVPLHLGQGGNPVVLVESTGEVRELTSLELEWDSAFLETASPRGRVIEVPGPRGWGMRWRDMSEAHSLRPAGSFDRFSWAARQEAELSRVVRGVALGMEIIASVNLSLWDPGLGQPFLDLMVEVRRPYAAARYGHWGAVPASWFCDVGLERDLHQGISPGCPGEEYMEALRESWTSAGLVLERMEGIARIVRRVDEMSSEEIHLSNIRAGFAYEVMDLKRNLDDLDGALGRLRRVSWEWDLVISVDLAGGG